jgi:hypothetical protein
LDGFAQIDDPSDMKKEQIVRLLIHWRRPVAACDLFRFSIVLVNCKTNETTPANYKTSFALQSADLGTSTSQSGALPRHSTPIDSISRVSTPTPIDPTPISTSHPSPITGAQSENPTSFDPAPISTSPITGAQSKNPTPFNSPDSEIRSPRSGPEGSTSLPKQSQSRPKPRPQKKTKHPTASLDDPNLNEEELGRPKRIPKRKLDDLKSQPELSQPQPQTQPRPRKKAKHPTASLDDANQNEENLGRPKRIQKPRLDIYLAAEEAEKNAKAKRGRNK